MARSTWKRREREAAKLIAGTRYPANQGGPVDCESDGWCLQAKERKTLSLAQMEALALEIERVAFQRDPPKLGVLAVKRSAGRGRATPWLFVVTESVWREMAGRLPGEEGPGA